MSGNQALHDATQDASSTRQTDLGSLSAQLFAPRPQVCFNSRQAKDTALLKLPLLCALLNRVQEQLVMVIVTSRVMAIRY